MTDTSRRVAALDCGTNSLRLLVADVDVGAGTLVDVERTMEVVRLGQGVDRTGAFAPEALERTFRAVDTAALAIERHDVPVEDVRFVATSASRDVSNRDEFFAGVRARLGVDPDVVPGHEEAALSFAGATRELHGSTPAPYLVVDLGGGSTEFVLGGLDLEAARSVDVGSVRLTERHLHDDPPTPRQIAAVRADVEAALALAEADVPLARTRTLVGVAGTVTTLTAAALDLTGYRPGDTHGVRLPVARVRDACDAMVAATRAERARMPFVHPGRVDVIGAGALVWRVVLDRLEDLAGITEVVTSEHDILDGIAFSLAENRNR